MHVLALDATTREGSVALVDDNRIIEERAGDPSRSHAERLPGELIDLARAHGLRVGDIDVFAVSSGPGSFTGLRIGIATIQGLALAAGRPIVAVSALEALAHRASESAAAGTFVAAWMDGYRRDVFTALYRVGEALRYAPGRLIELDPPAVGDPVETLGRWRERLRGDRILFVGGGALLYRDAIATLGEAAQVVAPTPLAAAAVGRLAAVRAARGETIDPGAARPLYIRRPDAELARDQAPRKTGPEPLRDNGHG